jgi:probable rRNA maturation factor
VATLDIRNLTRRKSPTFAFKKVLATTLPGWDISLVFAEPKKAQRLNRSLRKKTYVPNVLSYETGKKSGEIIICLSVAKMQAPEYGMTFQDFVGLLFIHALLHLKGMRHGSTMEKAERQVIARIAPHYPNETTNSNRHRHRHEPNKGRRR